MIAKRGGERAPSSTIRIAMVSRYPPIGRTHSGRGIGSYAKQLANALTQAGSEVVILADTQDEGRSSYVEGAVTVRRVWREGLSAVGDVAAALTDGGFSVVHLQHELFAFGPRAGALAAGRLLHRIRKTHPVVTTIHGIIPITAFEREFTRMYAGLVPPSVVKVIYTRIMKSVIRNSGLVVVHGEEILESVRAYNRISRSLVVPHGIADPAVRLSRDDGLRELGLADAKRAVFLGFLLPYKGIDTLQAAIPELSRHGIEVVIAGGESGDSHPTHKPRDRGQGSGARLLGFVPENLLPALFAVTDVLVLPYKVGLSMSGPFTLAAAYDVPVVVSDVPTLARVLRCPEATFHAGDAVGLSRAVKRVIEDSAVRAQVRDRMAAMKAEAAWPRVARDHISAYRQLIADHRDESGESKVGSSSRQVAQK